MTLKVARGEALREVQELLQDGRDINTLYICTRGELDDAGKRKLDWMHRVSQRLSELTGDGAAADCFAVVVAGVPDASAPIETHSEYFHTEMSQRLERLQAVQRMIEDAQPPAGGGGAVRPAGTTPTPQPRPVAVESGKADGSAAEAQVELSLADSDAGAAVSPVGEGAVPPTTRPSPSPGVSAVLPAGKPQRVPATARPRSSASHSRAKVLLIQCSRNGTARQAISRFANQMNLSLEIVDNNPDQPHSIVDQLYNHRDAQFAIVYWGEPSGRELPGSAHPERYVGFALGRLGRGRVFILGSATTPPLPGFTRILVAQLDSTGGWQIQLARRMKSAGVDIDLNKLT